MKLEELLLKKKGILEYMKSNGKNEISIHEIGLLFGKSVMWSIGLGKKLAAAFPDEFEYERGVLKLKKTWQNTH